MLGGSPEQRIAPQWKTYKQEIVILVLFKNLHFPKNKKQKFTSYYLELLRTIKIFKPNPLSLRHEEINV